MAEAPTEALIVRASWEDQRCPGHYMTRLYAVLVFTADEAIAAVKDKRSLSDKVEFTGDRFSAKTTETFRLMPGDAIEL